MLGTLKYPNLPPQKLFFSVNVLLYLISEIEHKLLYLYLFWSAKINILKYLTGYQLPEGKGRSENLRKDKEKTLNWGNRITGGGEKRKVAI